MTNNKLHQEETSNASKAKGFLVYSRPESGTMTNSYVVDTYKFLKLHKLDFRSKNHQTIMLPKTMLKLFLRTN